MAASQGASVFGMMRRIFKIMMGKQGWLVIIVMVSGGCTWMNQTTFHAATLKWFGKSYAADVRRASLKQIHLEQRHFVDKRVLVSGEVDSVSELGTYFVLRQGERKLLVVQYDILQNHLRVRPGLSSESVKVVGTLTSQKKGLPALVAQYVVVDRFARSAPASSP